MQPSWDNEKNYGMYFAREVEEAPIQLTGVGHQKRTSELYYFDNSDRPKGYLLQYTLSGEGCVEVGTDRYTVRAGDAFFLTFPSETRYYYQSRDKSRKPGFPQQKQDPDIPWEFIYILFKGECIESYVRYVQKTLGTVFPLSLYHPVVLGLSRLFTDVRDNTIQDPFQLSCRVYELICGLCSIAYEKGSSLSAKMERARFYLDTEYANPSGVKGAADYLGISSAHLSRQFYKETGMHPVEYLTTVRIRQAARLLQDFSLSIEQIAHECGFSDGHYFMKVFRKKMHQTPSEFRSFLKKEGVSRILL